MFLILRMNKELKLKILKLPLKLLITKIINKHKINKMKLFNWKAIILLLKKNSPYFDDSIKQGTPNENIQKLITK